MKTKGERREERRDKERKRMDQGKKAKLWQQEIMKRAERLEREQELEG